MKKEISSAAISQPATYYENARREILLYLPKSFHCVLEIGCGKGTFLRQLPAGCELWGIEKNADAAREARNVTSRIFSGSFEEVIGQMPLDYFDLIIANDVIEHIYDYHAFFKKVRNCLNTGGCLVGSIPNVRYWGQLTSYVFKKEWEYAGTGILDDTHVRFFTRNSFLRTLRSHGFTVEILSPCNRLKFHSFGLRAFSEFLIAHLVVGLTFGYFRDVLAFQYGFRAVKPSESILEKS